MQIYLLRHGIAENGRTGQSDSERSLTSEGRKKLREILCLARDAGVSASLILSSPYRRAVQTAAIAAEVFSYKEELLRTRALEPTASPSDVWEEVRAHKGEEQLLLVGHEPLFSSLGAYLLGAQELAIDFKKGALLRIDLESFGAQPHGVLKWLLVPKLARSAG
ncbi:MAG TPA: phosphohistidine phosphatase SixA [Bryobacteraceae bacterium]|nr:phosphohistidine phosphatase SixA [Bryobacteraceae bacterium]